MLNHSDCNIFKKKSIVTLASEVWQMRPNTSSLFHPTLLLCDQPFSNSLHFPKKIWCPGL